MNFRPEFELDILLISPSYRKERKQGAPWRELLPCFIYFFQDQLVNKELLTESFHFLVFSSISFLINDIYFQGLKEEGRKWMFYSRALFYCGMVNLSAKNIISSISLKLETS